jgi:hypothetical protein
MRIGNLTSSEIYKIIGKGKSGNEFSVGGFSYIESKVFERNLGKSLATESNAKPLLWGRICEKHFFENSGRIEYTPLMNEPIHHPSIEYYAGSPDAFKGEDVVCELKCPFTLLSFCQLVDPIVKGYTGLDAMGIIRDTHTDGEKYYWQMVSNSILSNRKQCEFIVYCPYEWELNSIRSLAEEQPLEELSSFYFISTASDKALPCLPNGGFYKNVYSITFTPPQEDIDLLTKKIELCKDLILKES